MLALIITSFVWAFSYGLIKTKLAGLDPNFVAAIRLVIASLVFLPMLRLRGLSFAKVMRLAGIGAIQYGLMYLCFLQSFQYLDAYQAALFTTMTPIYVVLVNNCYKQRFNWRYLQIASIAVLGGVIIYYQNMSEVQFLTGFFLVQLADLSFAFGQVAYKRFREQHSEIADRNIYACLFMGAAITAIIATFGSGGWGSSQVISYEQLGVLLYLGVVASGLCFFLWNYGAVRTNTATLAVFNNLKSPLAIAVSLLFFGESTNIPRLLLGMSLIAIALYLAEQRNTLLSGKMPIADRL